MNEFWTNNRVGCILDDEFVDDFEDQFGKHYGPKNTFWGIYLRSERGFASFFNVIGSLLFLLGSIMFIPGKLFSLYWGDVLFIWGSVFVMAGSIWKICRRGVDNPQNPSDRSWHYSKLVSNTSQQGKHPHESYNFISVMVFIIFIFLDSSSRWL